MKRLYVSLTTRGSVEKVIKELEACKKDIVSKTELFVSRLIDMGIYTAKANSGQYANYIRFTKEIHSDDGVTGVLVATDGVRLIREWYTDKGAKNKRSYEVSPLLLAEFGSGWLAEVLDNVAGVGQGTMPNSYGHAADDDGWYWYDATGTKHHSIGEAPSFPMHNAVIEMMNDIEAVAREVYGGK